MRRLEIGPGSHPLPGFEALDIVRRPGVRHVGNAASPPFEDETFDEVYSSHCIEHVDWWLVEKTIAEWVRSEEHTSELQSLMRISYAVFCLKKKKKKNQHKIQNNK